MSQEPLLAVEKLEVVYQRAITAIQGITLQVNEGQIVALLGTNGAGKTTTLRAISGFLGLDDARVTEGAIRYAGRNLQNRPPNETTRLGLTLVPERDKVFQNLSVAENLSVVPRRKGSKRSSMSETVYHFFPRLAELRRREAGLMCDPELLLIDELSLGLSPVAVGELTKSLVAIRAELGISILLVEQSAAVALSIADYGYVLENGRVVLDGDAERLRSNSEIQEFYLGNASGDRRSYRDVKQYRRSRRWYG